MFLALKELKYTKTKFALIIAVIILISYLVIFFNFTSLWACIFLHKCS